MADTADSSLALDPLHLDQVNLKPQYAGDPSQALTTAIMKFYTARATHVKSQVDQHAAEIQQRQDKMRLINDMIAEINQLTDDKNNLDISQQTELLEKIQLAKDLGVKITEKKFQFNAIERDRFIENLHLTADSWDKENRHQTQKMEVLIKELDRVMLLLKDVDRKEDQAKRAMSAGIRGG